MPSEHTATTTKSGRKRLIIGACSVLAVGGLLTAAAFTDVANINLGAGSDGIIGGEDSTFALLVADADADGNPITPVDDSDWVSANTAAGITYNLAGAELLVPGDSVSVDIPVKNDSVNFDALLGASIVNMDPTGDSTLIDALRFTVTFTDEDGVQSTVISDAALAAATAALGTATLSPGADGEFGVTVSLPSTAGNEMQGKTAEIRAVIDAQSQAV
ncbi:hypothetical protein [Leifsonia poae]|uniref:Uncharacterized protein n=1 Tax=Leifsonia poae TaxID=110933 RepID=A0A9W6LYK0_9MICO|nr:hypothetical protein [Leifsonia poae]GLJ74911.1 hypothetical protein GCM10017584_04840 [Leifsonia poae]